MHISPAYPISRPASSPAHGLRIEVPKVFARLETENFGGFSRGLTPNLSLESLKDEYAVDMRNPGRRSPPLHGKPSFDVTQVHLERVWQSLERQVGRAKQAHRRSNSVRKAYERGEMFEVQRFREAKHRTRVKNACESARYARAADAKQPTPPPLMMPEPQHIIAMRQQRADAHLHRQSQDHISFLPLLPEAADLAKRTWAAPAFKLRPATSSATSVADEAAEAKWAARSLGAGQGEAFELINAWKGPTAEKKAGKFIRQKTKQLVLDKATTFVPYNPDDDEFAVLYGYRPAALLSAAEAAADAPDESPDGPPAASEAGSEPRPTTSPNPNRSGARLLEPLDSPPRGSTSQGVRASPTFRGV